MIIYSEDCVLYFIVHFYLMAIAYTTFLIKNGAKMCKKNVWNQY